MSLTIGGKVIDRKGDAFVVAEAGHNHQGDLGKALEMIRRAKEVGADAIKFQKRSNRKIFTRALYNAPYDNENSFGKTYGEHREALEFNQSQYRELMQCAKEAGIICFATAFDEESADMLQSLDVPCFKTASGDLTNTPLLRHIARFGKPMLISTGGAKIDDVRRAYDAVAEFHHQICIMQCTAAYPVHDYGELNLRVIERYGACFADTVIGYSGHDAGIAMSVAAFVLGARVIEKHFTLSRVMKGTDHAFSLEPKGLERMVRDLKRTRLALGDGDKRTYSSEVAPLRKMAKSVYSGDQGIAKGQIIREKDLAVKSPGGGIPPYELSKIVGRSAKEDILPETLLTKEMFS